MATGILKSITNKQSALNNLIKKHKRVLVAYSGGVDSNFLLYVASRLDIKLKAVTFNSPLYPTTEIDRAINNAKQFGVEHEIINVNPLEIEAVKHNRLERCYECKHLLFSKLVEIAQSEGYDYIYDGSNIDDLSDYRPGMKACKELGIISPLVDAGYTKQDIREQSSEAKLDTWNIPSFACYLSRFMYDTDISLEMIEQVKHAETSLHSMGITSARVRHHNETARIELSALDFDTHITNSDIRYKIVQLMKEAGFVYISVDLEEYKTGSMNKSIKN